MDNQKFKIGDRVRVIETYRNGEIGYIVSTKYNIVVEFTEKIDDIETKKTQATFYESDLELAPDNFVKETKDTFYFKKNIQNYELLLEKICTEKNINISNLEYCEETILKYEDKILNKDFDDIFFIGHGITETKIELEKIYDTIYEGSHGNLKFCYRLGFNKNTGEQVAVQFILEPDKITAVGDKDRLTQMVTSVLGISQDEKIDQMHDRSVDKLKQIIRKKGHVDFRTKALKVDAIFTRSHKSMKTVEIIGMFNDNLNNAIRYTLGEINLPFDTSLFNLPEFQKYMAKYFYENPSQFPTEKYTVGEYGGDEKYKTTKIIWNPVIFKTFALTPLKRGFTGRGNRDFRDAERDSNRYNDNSAFTNLANKYINSDLLNKPRKGSIIS